MHFSGIAAVCVLMNVFVFCFENFRLCCFYFTAFRVQILKSITFMVLRKTSEYSALH